MTDAMKSALTKVPAVTPGFWIIKILATIFGETAGAAGFHAFVALGLNF